MQNEPQRTYWVAKSTQYHVHQESLLAFPRLTHVAPMAWTSHIAKPPMANDDASCAVQVAMRTLLQNACM